MGGFARNAAPDDPRPLDAVLDEAMAAFAGARAVIVDVSNNRGGWPGNVSGARCRHGGTGLPGHSTAMRQRCPRPKENGRACGPGA